MTRLTAAQGFISPFSLGGGANNARYQLLHFAADFVTIEYCAGPAAVEALRPVRVGRGRRYALAVTNRVNHLLGDRRGMGTDSRPEEH